MKNKNEEIVPIQVLSSLVYEKTSNRPTNKCSTTPSPTCAQTGSIHMCFIWQIGRGLPLITSWIEKNERPCAKHGCHYLTYTNEERTAVQEADILILSSGGDSPYSLIRFLDDYDIRSKVIVISTVFSADHMLDRTPVGLIMSLKDSRTMTAKASLTPILP